MLLWGESGNILPPFRVKMSATVASPRARSAASARYMKTSLTLNSITPSVRTTAFPNLKPIAFFPAEMIFSDGEVANSYSLSVMHWGCAQGIESFRYGPCRASDNRHDRRRQCVLRVVAEKEG